MWEERNPEDFGSKKQENTKLVAFKPIPSSSSIRRLDQSLPEVPFTFSYLRITFFSLPFLAMSPHSPFPMVWSTLARQGKLYSTEIKSLYKSLLGLLVLHVSKGDLEDGTF